MSKVGKGKVYTITILIQWQDDDVADIEDIARGVQSNTTSRNKGDRNYATPQGLKGKSAFHVSERHPQERLRPTDKLVLSALRASVSEGTQVTVPISVRELMVECQISRRQVQICLKRLIEKSLIERLVNAGDWGSHEGCRYQIARSHP